jgi:hypothetical protein
MYKLFFSIILFFVIIFGSSVSNSEGIDQNLIKDYDNVYLSGYLKPLFTTLQQGFNSDLYTHINFNKEWWIGIDLSANAMMIPNSQKTFEANVPVRFQNKNTAMKPGDVTDYINTRTTSSQPTLYGGKSTPIFSPDDRLNATGDITDTLHAFTYLEGFNLDNMSGAPNFQVIFGLPTQTEIRFKVIPVADLMLYGFNVNQRLDEYFDLFGKSNENHALGIHLGYNSVSFKYDNLSTGFQKTVVDFSLATFCAGINYSYKIVNNLNAYTSLQYESIDGTFKALFQDKNSAPIEREITVDSYTNYRFTAGMTYRLSFIELHGDVGYASQPTFTAGLTFWFSHWTN